MKFHNNKNSIVQDVMWSDGGNWEYKCTVGTEVEFNFRWRGLPDSSVSSLIWAGWRQEGQPQPVTKISVQFLHG